MTSNILGVTLYSDGGNESRLAEEYLRETDLNFDVRKAENLDIFRKPSFWFDTTAVFFRNCFGEPEIPSVVSSRVDLERPALYVSFSGVKAFLRGILGGQFGQKRPYWENIQTFYPSSEYDRKSGNFGKERRLITCFDEFQKNVFEGEIDRSPYPLEERLERHPYHDWYEVSCWKIGNLRELSTLLNGNVAIHKPSQTILFKDEITALGDGREIITEDSSSIYHVTYSSYFAKDGLVYSLYADMVD